MSAFPLPPVAGGYVFWQEDIAPLIETQRVLGEVKEELQSYGDFILEENRQKARRKQLEAKQKLYAEVQEKTAHSTELLYHKVVELHETADAASAERLLAQIMVVGAYVKRRNNLVLLADKSQNVPSRELSLCLRESAANLQMLGVKCAYNLAFEGDMNVHAAADLFDFYEQAVEASLNTLAALSASFTQEPGGYAITLLVSGPKAEILKSALCRGTVENDESGTIYATLSVPERGGCRMKLYLQSSYLWLTVIPILLFAALMGFVMLFLSERDDKMALRWRVAEVFLAFVTLILLTNTLVQKDYGTLAYQREPWLVTYILSRTDTISPSHLLQLLTLALASCSLFLLALSRYVYLRRFRKPVLSRSSIKEGFDNLPSGGFFASENGEIVLCNLQMHRLCQDLLGSDLQHLSDLNTALAKPPKAVTCVEEGAHNDESKLPEKSTDCGALHATAGAGALPARFGRSTA